MTIPKLFLSRGLYGARRWNHRDLFKVKPGWLMLEFGSWTLEVFYTPGLARAVARVVIALTAASVATFGAPMAAQAGGVLDAVLACVGIH